MTVDYPLPIRRLCVNIATWGGGIAIGFFGTNVGSDLLAGHAVRPADLLAVILGIIVFGLGVYGDPRRPRNAE